MTTDQPEINPELAELLARFRFDLPYVRGSGPYLYDEQGTPYLDLCTNYGALPLGHNPPEVWAAIEDLRGRNAPALVRPGYPAEARELAQRLMALAPGAMHAVTYAQSGGEAVEAACHAARAATGRQLIAVAHGGFHGGALGEVDAVRLAAPRRGHKASMPPGFLSTRYGDADSLAAALEAHRGLVAAFLVEPVQGEGGVVVPPAGYLRAAEELCRRHGALLLVDEVLTGLGRTGVLFACADEVEAPDAVILSKALGGGLVPMAACLHASTCWTSDFALGHSSTYAGHALGAACGLRVLDLLTAHDGALLASVASTGEHLLAELRRVAARYPEVVAEVRGRGFLIGLRLGPLTYAPGTSLRAMAEEGYLAPLLCGYLLHREHLRMVPSLSDGRVVRITPPLRTTPEQLEEVAPALERVCERVVRGDLRELCGYLLEREAPLPEDRDFRLGPGEPPIETVDTRRREAPAEAGRFAFLVHPLDLKSYEELEPAFVGAPRSELATLGRLLRGLFPPVALSRVVLRSETGAVCQGQYITTTMDSSELLGGPRDQVLDEIRQMIALARDGGAQVVGLGALTAVVTGGGVRLGDCGVPLTTGNSLTVQVAVEGLLLAAQRLGIEEGHAEAAVVGAPGTVGRVVAHLLAPMVRRLNLIGNSRSEDAPERLRTLADEITATAPGAVSLRLTTRPEEVLPSSRLVLSATSDPGTVVNPDWIAPGAVVCDVARPPDVSLEVRQRRRDVLVIDGGVLALPEPITLGFGFGHDRGVAFACMCETMLMALERRFEPLSFGPELRLENVHELARLAAKHGFRTAGLRSFGRPVTDAVIASVRSRAPR